MKLEQQRSQVDWGQKESSCQVVLRHGPRAQVLRERKKERKKERREKERKERKRFRESMLKFTQDTR